MKRLYILVILLVFTVQFTACGQSSKKPLNEFLILGTLNDYMGRILYPGQEDFLDRYDRSETVMRLVIDSLIKVSYSSEIYNGLKKGVNDISSVHLANRFNSFYDYSESGSYTPQGKTILTGKLKPDMMQTEQEKFTFLTGTYLRFGSFRDTAHCISIGNSLSKAQVCYVLLKELGCEPYYNIRKNIPTVHEVFFHPTPIFKAYLEKYTYLHQQIEEGRATHVQKMLEERKQSQRPID